jgi:alpha-L-fucosidase 2
LPALPSAWKKGHIHGLVARGGFEIDIDWDGGKLTSVKVLSRLGNACTIRYGDEVMQLKTEKGKTYTFNGSLK